MLGRLNLYSAGATQLSAWEGLHSGAILWLVAIIRIVQPPFEDVQPTPAAFAGAALMAVIVTCGVAGARRE